MSADVPAASRRQDESRKIGNESRLAEKVVDARENTTVHDKARQDRFKATGEGQCESAEDVS